MSAHQDRIQDGPFGAVLTVKVRATMVNNHGGESVLFHGAYGICDRSANRNPALNLGSGLRLVSREKLFVCSTANSEQ